jgi:glyoxylase-like metal-dependent hydrolase (beta-lactamase superfamily II)
MIKTIRLPMPFRLGSVNAYLLRTDKGFTLIDTGPPGSRSVLTRELDDAGCQPSTLQLIILTHGDFDHTGNAAYLRTTFQAAIAMHIGDLGMTEQGNMFWNRSRDNALIRFLAPVLFRFGKSLRFKPDLYLNDGDSLADHGLDARILSLTGHSSGSIGILTADGALFCGDLLENLDRPKLNSIMDDLSAATSSLERLTGLGDLTVYPGHGEPFRLDQLTQPA